MTDLIDISGSALIFRRPDGSVMLDTSDRQPAKLGELEVTTDIVWPNPSGAGIQVSGSNVRYVFPALEAEYETDLGAAPVGYTPNFIMANVNLERQESTDLFGFVYVLKQTTENVNRPWNSGSLWVETIRTTAGLTNPIANRHMHIEIRAGRFVVVQKHSSRAYASSYGSYPGGTGDATATWAATVRLSYGLFDL